MKRIFALVAMLALAGCNTPHPATDAPFMHQTNAIPQPYWTNALPAVTP